MKKKNRIFLISFITPALLCFVLLFLYPITRTAFMSFFEVSNISDPVSKWNFVGWGNFAHLFRSTLFRASMMNMTKIWIFGGVITICFAFLFAVILTSGVKLKKFWRSVIYLPNTISAVALANMWLQYVYNNKFGLFQSVFTSLGLNSLANVQWTSGGMLFTSMLIAYCFGSIGYFMLILMAGIERIPKDLYESAYLDGAGTWKQFKCITFPLVRDVFRTCVMLWTVTTVNFFVWSRMFSKDTSPFTVTPVVYMYDAVFGLSSGGITANNAGAGTAIGVLLTIIVVVVFAFMNKFFKERKLEY